MLATVHYYRSIDDLSPFFAMLRRIFTGYEALLEMDVPS